MFYRMMIDVAILEEYSLRRFDALPTLYLENLGVSFLNLDELIDQEFQIKHGIDAIKAACGNCSSQHLIKNLGQQLRIVAKDRFKLFSMLLRRNRPLDGLTTKS